MDFFFNTELVGTIPVSRIFTAYYLHLALNAGYVTLVTFCSDYVERELSVSNITLIIVN